MFDASRDVENKIKTILQTLLKKKKTQFIC